VSQQHLAEAIVGVLEQAYPRRNGTLALHEPQFSGIEWDYVNVLIRAGCLRLVRSVINIPSSQGLRKLL